MGHTTKGSSQERMLETLARLLEIPSADFQAALTNSCNLVAEVTGADKVDAFLYQPERDTLFALGTSTQPLSALQKKLGLDVLPVSNGGRVVLVYQTGQTFVTGRTQDDSEELRGVKQAMKIGSELGVPLQVGEHRRGVLMIASLKPDFFTPDDVRFVETVARWVAVVAHKAELVEEIARNAVEQGRRAVAEEMITVLAHDMRNFVAPIAARVELLRLRAAKDGRHGDVADCQAAGQAIVRLKRLIGDLLDVARLDQGVLRLDIQPIDLGGLAREAAGMLSSPDHAITVDCMEETVVAADPDRIRQCVENLVSNAIRHSPAHAADQVIVSQERRDTRRFGRIEVRDEGPGVPADLLPRIFERFVAGPGSPGLGLGLYLARRIALAHGGDLAVQSTLGKGARFTLTVPLHREQERSAGR